MREESENAFRRVLSLQAETRKPDMRELFDRFACPRTVSPSLVSCPASHGASSFLSASALATPRGLATSQRTRRAIRPTDFCHPNDWRVPVPRAFPARCRGFHRVGASRSLGSVRLDRGIERFHDARDASADRESICFILRSRSGGSPIVRRAWAYFFPRCSSAIEPLAPLSLLLLASRDVTRLRAHVGREGAAETPVAVQS